MATTRLNKTHRSILMHFMKKNVSCPKEQKARDAAYNKAAATVRAACEKRFPPTEMAILEKYKVAVKDRCIRGGNPDGAFVNFEFDSDADAPLLPNRYCSSRSIPFSSSQTAAVHKAEQQNGVLKDALGKKRSIYRALINGARTYEEVLDAWPAAIAVETKIRTQRTALTLLSQDQIMQIRADNAGASLVATP